MSWGWMIGAILFWLMSAICIIGSIVEVGMGKSSLKKGGFWGGVAFHAVTALIALALFLKALGQ